MWAGIFCIPAVIIVMFTRDPQLIVTYTGGIAGTFILFLFPLTLVTFARKAERDMGPARDLKGVNCNASPFQSTFWWCAVLIFAITTLCFVLWGIIEGNAGE